MTLYQKLFGLQLMAPAGEDGSGGGGGTDRGDDFVPTDDEDEVDVVNASIDEAEEVIEEVTKPRAPDGNTPGASS